MHLSSHRDAVLPFVLIDISQELYSRWARQLRALRRQRILEVNYLDYCFIWRMGHSVRLDERL
jgi:hypothetical protein